jgi:hypothetical protein
LRPLMPSRARFCLATAPLATVWQRSRRDFERVSCVLEYVDDVAAAVQEINRIAGSADNVFIVTVHSWSLPAHLYPGARWAGSPTNDGGVAMRPVSSSEKVAIVGALVALALAACWRR